jgi:Domain of unknown function (DUF4132)
MALGSLARQLLARLTAPAPDHPSFIGEQEPPDVSSLTPEELGAIWSEVDRAHHGGRAHAEATPDAPVPAPWDANRPAYQLACAILDEVSSQRHWPRITDAQALEYLARSEGQYRGWQRALAALAWRDAQVPLLPEMVEQLRRILGPVDPAMPGLGHEGGVRVVGRLPEEALCIARHLQADSGGPEVEALSTLLRERVAEGRYAGRLLELTLALSRDELQAQCWPRYGFPYVRDPRYRALDEFILRDACAHLEAIQRGDVPYVGYKAFPDADVNAIATARHRCALREEPWLSPLAHQILTLSVVAPDRKSKSLPSQALATRLAEAISQLPTPAGIESLKEAAGLAINATVKRALGIRVAQAKTALALRPEVVLAMAANGPPDKKRQTLLATLLQASYPTGLDFSLADWRTRLCLSPGAGMFTQGLIWLARAAADTCAVSFMAQATESGIAFTDAAGATVQVSEDARIRLWHPLHACSAEREAWQARLRRLQLRQPLRQAFREYYEPLPEELGRPADADALWASNRSQRFGDYRLALEPLLGLARGEGWKIEREAGLVRKFGELEAVFELGDEVYPGMHGDIDAVALSFWHSSGSRRSRVPIRDAPPVSFSEACRAADLLVSTCAYAYTGDDPRGPLTVGEAGIVPFGDETPARTGPEHPRLKRERRLHGLGRLPIAGMLATRRRVLMDVFADSVASGHIVFEERHATIGEYSVHLGTARVSRLGVQLELKLPKPGAKGSKLAALPWVPYDEVLLEKLVAIIATLA